MKKIPVLRRSKVGRFQMIKGEKRKTIFPKSRKKQCPSIKEWIKRYGTCIKWSITSPGGGNGNPLQYSCLENPTDRGAWRATVHRVTEGRTQLSD